MKSIDNNIKRFFLISHGLPLIVTIMLMLISNSFIITNPILGKLLYIGFISPTVAALYVVYRYYSKAGIRDFWTRLVDYKRVSWKWWVFIALFPFCIRIVAALTDGFLLFNEFTFSVSPTMTIGYALILLPFGPIPEEIGWRGVALPELQKKYGIIVAVVILGVMWSLWHIPLFLVEGTYQYNLGLLSPLFFNFFLQAFFSSIILAVVYYKTKHSILAVIILHYLENLMGETFEMTETAQITETVIRGVIAILMLAYYCKSIDENSTTKAS